MRRLAVLVVTSLLLAGSGVAGAFGLPKTDPSTPAPSAQPVVHPVGHRVGHPVDHRVGHPVDHPDFAVGAPKIKPGTKSKWRADANALTQAQLHPNRNEPRHKRHPRPAPTSSPSSTSTPTP